MDHGATHSCDTRRLLFGDSRNGQGFWQRIEKVRIGYNEAAAPVFFYLISDNLVLRSGEDFGSVQIDFGRTLSPKEKWGNSNEPSHIHEKKRYGGNRRNIAVEMGNGSPGRKTSFCEALFLT